jgi:hypothetical protein
MFVCDGITPPPVPALSGKDPLLERHAASIGCLLSRAAVAAIGYGGL